MYPNSFHSGYVIDGLLLKVTTEMAAEPRGRQLRSFSLDFIRFRRFAQKPILK